MTSTVLAEVATAAGLHPNAALSIVALVAFAESLAVVGTFVPAAVFMFCVGALVGHGTLGALPALICAAAGAVAGDALSYEAGRRPAGRGWIAALARRHPGFLEKSEVLMERRGAASVLIGRFTGALRAFVPFLAGAARMPRGRFYLADVASAVIWAPAHILPGAVFGASLQVAEAVSGRLAVILILLVALVWAATWAVTRLRRVVAARLAALRQGIVEFLRGKDAYWARAVSSIVDPKRSGSPALWIGMVLLLAAGWLFFGVLEDVATRDPLVHVDAAVFGFLQQLRTRPVDRVMVLVTEAGSVGVMLPLIGAVAGWLAWRRAWRTCGYWLASVAFAELLVKALKYTLGRQRPTFLYQGSEQFSFPSGHASVAAVVLGFLAFLLSRGQTPRWRNGVVILATFYVVMVAFSRLYLGAHWLSDVVGGVSFGLAWVACVSMVYTHRDLKEDLAPRALTVVAACTLAGSTLVWHQWRGAADQRLYGDSPQLRVVSEQTWRATGWRQLPARRRELEGDEEEGFSIQFACDAGGILQELGASGWRPAKPWSMESALLALRPAADLLDLPVLLRLDQGRRAALTLVGAAPDGPESRQVLRLWRSDTEAASVSGVQVPLWYGAIYVEQRTRGPYPLRTRVQASVSVGRQWRGGRPPAMPVANGASRAGPTLLSCAPSTAGPR